MRIMQCWDDGNVDDIKLVEILKKHGAKATFNLNPGVWKSERRLAHKYKGVYDVYNLTLDEMPQVFKGFCIGGHTMTHPNLTVIDPEWALTELVENKKYIEKHFGQKECGMAYPYGTYNDKVKEMVREAGYLYSRTVNNLDLKLNIDDPMALNTHCHFLHADFWQKFEAVKAVDGDFYFWGHTYELMGEDKRWRELDSLIGKLTDGPATEWVDVRDLFM